MTNEKDSIIKVFEAPKADFSLLPKTLIWRRQSARIGPSRVLKATKAINLCKSLF